VVAAGDFSVEAVEKVEKKFQKVHEKSSHL